MELRNAKDFVALGYEVQPSVNGGYLLIAGRAGERNAFRADVATFTNTGDLFAWLLEGHSNYDKTRVSK